MENWKINHPVFEADEFNPKLKVAPWEGHRWFAYDYISFIKPKKVVELGTHYGCSFFSFCQAAKDHSPHSDLVAIDTWTGDEQAGFYEETVYETVNRTVEALFDDLSIDLKRKTFDEALSEIDDESIDLIHIDGLHTYEAVKHDYDTWLPKLSNNGVIFFHDVFSPLEYGSNIFWDEIKRDFLHLEFKHSWGLGILFPKNRKVYDILADQNITDKILYYTAKASYELEKLKTEDLSKMVEKRDEWIKKNEQMIQERDEAMQNSEAMVKERDSIIKSNEAILIDYKEAIKHNEQMIEQRDQVIHEYENTLNEYKTAFASMEEMIRERDKAIQSMEILIQERDQLCRTYEAEIIDLKSKA